jgi:hypothetical protein
MKVQLIPAAQTAQIILQPLNDTKANNFIKMHVFAHRPILGIYQQDTRLPRDGYQGSIPT